MSVLPASFGSAAMRRRCSSTTRRQKPRCQCRPRRRTSRCKGVKRSRQSVVRACNEATIGEAVGGNNSGENLKSWSRSQHTGQPTGRWLITRRRFESFEGPQGSSNSWCFTCEAGSSDTFSDTTTLLLPLATVTCSKGASVPQTLPISWRKGAQRITAGLGFEGPMGNDSGDPRPLRLRSVRQRS